MQGYSKPFSPSGKASLMLPSPHHYGGAFITAVFRADPAAVRAVIPEPLEPVPDGLCYAWICDLTCVADDPSIAARDPGWVQYQEGVISVDCQYKGQRGRTSPYLWVNRDWSLMFGWLNGWGKKLGEIELTRTHANGVNPGLPDFGPGTRLGGYVARRGARVMDLQVQLTEPATEPLPTSSTIFAVRHFPAMGASVPAVNQLVMNRTQGVVMKDHWNATGTLRFYESDNEELTPLQPTEIVRCMYYRRGWTTSHEAELLMEYRDAGDGAAHLTSAATH